MNFFAASSAPAPAAKAVPAQWLCLTHNLIRRMEEELASQEGVVNEPDHQRHLERLAPQKEATQQARRLWPST